MKTIICLLISFILLGCQTTQTIRIQQPVVCTAYQKPDQISPRSVTLFPIQDEEGKWWVGVDAKNYGNIAINNSAMLEYIIQTRGVISYLEACIERHNRAANSE